MTESAFTGALRYVAKTLAASTTYYGTWGCADSITFLAETTEARNAPKMRGATTLQNLRVQVSVNGRTVNDTLSQRNNGAAGNLTVSLTATTTGLFADTTHTDSIADGSTWTSTYVSGASGANTIGLAGASLEMVSSSQAAVQLNSTTATGASGANARVTFAGSTGFDTTEAKEQITSPGSAATLSNLQAYISTGVASNQTWVSRINAVTGNQTLTATLSTTGLYEDTTHSDTLASNDAFNAHNTGTAGGTWAFFAIKVAGSAANRTMLASSLPAGQTLGNNFHTQALGYFNLDSTEGHVQTPAPTAGTWDYATFNVRANTAASTTTVISRVATANGVQSVAITASTTGVFQDTTHADSVTAAQLINYKSSGANASSTTCHGSSSRWTGPSSGNAYTLTAASGSYSISGTATALKLARVMPGASGSYAITGTAAAFRHGYPLTAAAGSYSITGATVALRQARILVAAAGSYAITGTVNALKRALLLVAGAGSYAISGTAALLRRGYPLVSAAGSYALTGTVAALRKTSALVASAGSYAISGTAAAFRRALRLVVTAGAYALTGTAAALVYGSLAASSLAADAGAYAISGATVAFKRGRIVVATAGAYALTGTAAALRFGRLLVAASGAYALTGTAAALRRGLRLVSAAGTYALTGTAAALRYGRLLAAAAGSYALTGAAVALRRTRIMPAAAGSYALNGTTISLTVQRRIAAGAGVYSQTGSPVGFYLTRVITITPGSYQIVGANAVLSRTRLNVPPTPAARTVNAFPAGRTVSARPRSRTVNASPSSRTVTPQER